MGTRKIYPSVFPQIPCQDSSMTSPANGPEPVTEANLAKLNGSSPTSSDQGSQDMQAEKQSQARSAKTSMTFSQRTMESMNSILVRSLVAVNAEPERLTTQKRKMPLSLPTTALNFRGFVQKSGPVFVFQDSVESTLMWDDWPWTTMWMGIWAVVSLNPRLLVCLPPVIAITIMCNTFFIRFPIREDDRNLSPSDALRKSLHMPDLFQAEPQAPPIEPRPVMENDIKYLMHMRDIQNMMRLIIDGYDHISPVVKYLNWSDVRRTLRIFQACIVLLLVTYFIAPLIPWRLVLFLGGELALVAHHPWLKPAIEAIKKQSDETPGRYQRAQRQHRLKQRLIDILDEDRLPEYVWQRGWKDVELFENQRLQLDRRGGADESRWSARNLLRGERRPWTRGSDGFSAEDNSPAEYELHAEDVNYELESGYEWIEGESWRIDWGGAWSPVGVDDAGYVYTDSSWRHAAPYAYGVDPAMPTSPTRWKDEELDEDHQLEEDPSPSMRALTRRRRWLRRAVRVAPPIENLPEDESTR